MKDARMEFPISEPLSWEASSGAYQIGLHYHDLYELIYVVEGVRELRIEGKRLTGRTGDLIIFRPHELHEEWNGSASISIFAFRFTEEKLAALDLSFPSSESVGHVVSLHERRHLQHLLKRMQEEVHRSDRFSSRLLDNYLSEFIIHLWRTVQPAPTLAARPPEERIHELASELTRHPERVVDVAVIARRAGMSVSQFNRRFKMLKGDSPRQFQIRRRIARACEFLSQTDDPAHIIAAKLGYDDAVYFYRQFKRQTGMTTGEFRERHRRAS